MLLRTGMNNVVLPHCARLSTMVNNIVTCHSASTMLLNVLQYCSMLLTTVNNVGGTTLFNPVELQALDFLVCMDVKLLNAFSGF